MTRSPHTQAHASRSAQQAEPLDLGPYSCRAVARFVERTLREIKEASPKLLPVSAAAAAWYRGGYPLWEEDGCLGWEDGGAIALGQALGYLATLPEWDRLHELTRHHARRLVYAFAHLDGLSEPTWMALQNYPTREQAEAVRLAMNAASAGDGGPRNPPSPTRAGDRMPTGGGRA